jgi:hypothetical protein
VSVFEPPSYLGITEADIERKRYPRGGKAARLPKSERKTKPHIYLRLHALEVAEYRRDAAHYQLTLSDFMGLLWRNWKSAGKPPLVCLPCEYDMEPEDD